MTLLTIILTLAFGGACAFAGFVYGGWYVREVIIDRELEKKCYKTRMTVKLKETDTHCPKVINHYKIEDMYIDANLN